MSVTAPPKLGGIDHLEWWVGNARAFAAFLASAFGFEPVARAGPETGRRDRVSYLLQQGDVRFLITGGLTPESPGAFTYHCTYHAWMTATLTVTN